MIRIGTGGAQLRLNGHHALQFQAYASADTINFANTGSVNGKKSLPSITDLASVESQVPAGAYAVDSSAPGAISKSSTMPTTTTGASPSM